jgi:hypothetical protein
MVRILDLLDGVRVVVLMGSFAVYVFMFGVFIFYLEFLAEPDGPVEVAAGADRSCWYAARKF